VLDDILEGLVENEQPVAEIVARGHDEALVKRIQHMLYIAEYKRRQAAPGVKITRRNSPALPDHQRFQGRKIDRI